MNDVPNASNVFAFILYADDTTLFSGNWMFYSFTFIELSMARDRPDNTAWGQIGTRGPFIQMDYHHSKHR